MRGEHGIPSSMSTYLTELSIGTLFQRVKVLCKQRVCEDHGLGSYHILWTAIVPQMCCVY
jgi:hypothetical protein